jgi:hypothetical protein
MLGLLRAPTAPDERAGRLTEVTRLYQVRQCPPLCRAVC